MLAGKYTSKDGTRNNATILDINNDLQYYRGSAKDNEDAIGLRVADNAQRATIEAEEYLEKVLCNYVAPTHDDLRHLLAPDGFWIALMFKVVGYSGVSTTIYKEKLSPNATVSTQAVVAISAAGLTIMDGILGRQQGNGRFSFMEAQIINVLTAWYRHAVQVGADNQVSGCLSNAVVQNAIAALPESSDDSVYFDALDEQTMAELGQC